jgi:ubiquinone biosynthesis protein UbiJ
MGVPDVILAPVQAALDALVNARLKSRDQVKELDDKVVQVTLTGLPQNDLLTLYICAEGERLVLKNSFDGTPDAAIAGSIPAFLRALAKPGATLPDDIAAEGDTSLVRDLRDLLGGLQFDWEDRLSRVTGDPIAHGIGEFVRRSGRAAGYAGDRLLRDVAEYLREETRQVVSKAEVAGFVSGVHTVRDEVERFAARVAQFESRARPDGDRRA